MTNKEEEVLTNDELTDRLEKSNAKIINLHRRLTRLEKGGAHTGLPNTMILSHSFIKRAFAVYGHVLAVGLIIMIPLYCVIFALAAVFQPLVE